ncbi:MAG: hypothetical protein KDD46_07735, partial [Bdellovibrionales bacterium]|nr:hypothetical protein [Bdellovibrionales bacterium]
MSKPPNDINPILSQAERDLYFTDPGYELFGSSLTNVKRIFRKKPWFSQKMNLQGRILQATITLCISMIGMGLGFTFLKIPPRMEAVRLLLTHGYRGPYYG